MVPQEIEEGPGRKSHHLITGGGPDGRPHGQQVMVYKQVTIATGCQIFAQASVSHGIVGEIMVGIPVKPEDIPDHGVIGRTQQVFSLGKQGIQAGTRVCQSGFFAPITE